MKTLRAFVATAALLALFAVPAAAAGDKDVFLVHLKTSLSHNDALICVAYNGMWAALEEGHKVKVLVDADAVTTFKTGWLGKDDIEAFKLPEDLRRALSNQFRVPLVAVPRTYGEYLRMLRDRGGEFYVNTGMLVVSGIGTEEEPLKNVSAKFFRPVTLLEMVAMREEARYYMSY